MAMGSPSFTTNFSTFMSIGAFQFTGLSRAEIDELMGEIKLGWAQERVKTELKQRQSAHLAHNTQHKAIEGLGRLRFQLDPVTWAHWRIKEGPGIWKDKAFKRAYERDNASVRIQCGGTKTQFGYK
jgi:hypothetical protein